MTSDALTRFVAFLDGLDDPENYHRIHRKRYVETFKRAASLIRPNMRLLEYGRKSPLALFFEKTNHVEEYTADLRYPISLPNQSFDVILALEVLEHLKDRDVPQGQMGGIGMFTHSGIISAFSEAHRILTPGGQLIVTTPNGTSVDAIGKLLLRQHAFLYEPHVREYAPENITKLATDAGFILEEFSTFFAWGPMAGIDREAILQTLRELRADTQHRGDDAFFIFSKGATI